MPLASVMVPLRTGRAVAGARVKLLTTSGTPAPIRACPFLSVMPELNMPTT